MTLEQFNAIFPNNKDASIIVENINKLKEKYELNTTNRMAGFLAQCGHESMGFTVMKENLNYSALGLQKVFKKYFPTKALANAYNRQPQKIANRVYANRYGNGSEASGDGYRYSGKGYIQLTFKSNYMDFAKSIGKTLEDTIIYLETIEGALESALWYWKNRKVISYCDKDDIVGMTKVINGGTIGLEDRTKHYEAFKKLLA